MSVATVESLIAEVNGRFESASLVYGHGTDNAWDEAVALVLGVSGQADDRESLNVALPEQAVLKIRALAHRRIEERIPLAYLLGRCQYLGLEFLIEPGIVIPRSPIGGLLIDEVEPWLTRAPNRILDVCTGSGCIGILAAHVWPEARVTLIDINPAAVVLARKNVALHGLEDRVEVIESDLLTRLPASARFDLIISNPPYVDAREMASLPREYQHEPALGLAGGDDGNELVRRLLRDVVGHMHADACFICEVGASAEALQVTEALPFIWPTLPTGGDGVFLLHARDLGVPQH
ncbi:MAG: 50S ribosomal protein L3 N(5)-glutamine methyltransferase [Pseudomonadales bacterium]